MARVTGPLHSDSASGRFAGALVYAVWKGRPYVRQLVIPLNPKSAAQLGVRAMMSWLSKWWTGISAGDKLTWDALAASKSISAFNAFVGFNLERWQTNDGPTEANPAAEANTDLLADDVAVDGEILTTTGADGYVDCAALPDSTGAADAVGVILFRAAAAPTPLSWAKAVKILEVTPGVEWTYTDSPLVAGTYHYKIAYFGDDGVIGALSAADNTGVVT